MGKINVLLVDKTSFNRNLLKRLINNIDIATVEYTASSGNIALERMKYSEFDVILYDINLLRSGKIKCVKKILSNYPDIKIIITSEVNCNVFEMSIESFNKDSIDILQKPKDENNIFKFTNNLILIFNEIFIKKNLNYPQISSDNSDDIIIRNRNANETLLNSKNEFKDPDVILIAASTGGPVALENILGKLNNDINVPILIIQHMPSQFTRSLAKSLRRVCKLEVREAQHGDIIKSGKVFIAPGGLHMKVKSEKGINRIHVEYSSYVNGVRPSADILFKSAAEVYRGKKVLVLVLTGMGCDGLEGVKFLKEQCICYCITQSEQSCVVYGMPKCVEEKGFSNESVNIDDIGYKINKLLKV